MIESNVIREYLNQVQQHSESYRLSKAIYTCATNIDELNKQLEKIKQEIKVLNTILEPVKKEAFKTIEENKTADALNTDIEEHNNEQTLLDNYILSAEDLQEVLE